MSAQTAQAQTAQAQTAQAQTAQAKRREIPNNAKSRTTRNPEVREIPYGAPRARTNLGAKRSWRGVWDSALFGISRSMGFRAIWPAPFGPAPFGPAPFGPAPFGLAPFGLAPSSSRALYERLKGRRRPFLLSRESVSRCSPPPPFVPRRGLCIHHRPRCSGLHPDPAGA